MSHSKPGAIATASSGKGKKRKNSGRNDSSDDGPDQTSFRTEEKRKREKAHTLLITEDFPIDSENPFETAFCGSDIELIVEGKRLHAHRVILSLYSSYFRALLSTQDFVEAEASEIELKSSEFVQVKYDAMVEFLKHLYPGHAFKRVPDDKTLTELFPLAEYFQCHHIRAKCESYMSDRLGKGTFGYSICTPTPSLLLYLRLCETYEVEQLLDCLLNKLTYCATSSVQHDLNYKCLTSEMQKDFLQRRVLYLEQNQRR